MPKPIATQLSDALGARQQSYGPEVLERFKQNALLPLDPTLANVIFYQGNLEKYNKPKLADGSPNPCWPEDAEIPRDESEREQFYKEIALKQYEAWIKRIEDGEFDRAPVLEAEADDHQDMESLADEFEETGTEVAEAREGKIHDETPETEVVSAEELEEEIDAMVKAGENPAVAEEEAKEKIKPDETKKEDWRVSDQELAHVTAMRELVRRLIVDSPHAIRKAGGDVKGLPALVERVTQMEDTLKVMHDEMFELKKARQAAKKLLLKHVDEFKRMESAMLKLGKAVAGKEEDAGDL